VAIGNDAMTAISMDGTDPASWDPQLDAVTAAPQHHQVLYEDDLIRVVSVSIAPGLQEPVHHHRWPSVFVIDRLPRRMRDFDGDGQEIPLPVEVGAELPLVVKFLPQPAHSVRNEDDIPFHGTRIEFKQGFPG
jgi:predicted metal-dependent enzyme (double-stranded beta helix superfamily)